MDVREGLMKYFKEGTTAMEGSRTKNSIEGQVKDVRKGLI
jgi:hypothetical protein